MENYIGKVCPFCKTEIKEGDSVKVCPACGIPHHKGCWEENKGCTTFGCSEQHYEAQHTNPTDVCSNCGAPLGEGQAFCPKCGTPKNAPKKNVCAKCGAELQDDQAFCPKCGQKVGLAVDADVNAAINQFNAKVTQTNGKKKNLPIIIGAAAVIVVALVVILLGGSKKDFNKMFSEYKNEEWCTIASDGSYMRIDTNPTDKDNDDIGWEEYTLLVVPADEAIEAINLELGFTSVLYQKMNTTTWSQGKQTDSNENYAVTWTYHPDKGLEVLYEIRN